MLSFHPHALIAALLIECPGTDTDTACTTTIGTTDVMTDEATGDAPDSDDPPAGTTDAQTSTDTGATDAQADWGATTSSDPTCEGVDIPGQVFAPCLADSKCDAPATVCATDLNGAVCIPTSSATCAEDHPGCAGPSGFGAGYGAQTDACTIACDVDADCPLAGMACGPNSGMCLWPSP